MGYRTDYRLIHTRPSFFCNLKTKKALRDVILPLIFGISVGILLGQIFLLDQKVDSQNYHYEIRGKREIQHENLFFIRCVVVIPKHIQKPQSYIGAIRDTYGNDCNQTMFYTTNRQLHAKVKDQRVFLIDSNLDFTRWKLLQYVLDNSAEIPAQWTVLLDAQVFLQLGNLRKLLEEFDENKPTLLGRVVASRSFLSSIFPVSQDRIALQAGVVLSRPAVDLIIDCSSSIFPYSSETTLLRCAHEKAIQIRDPIDQEGKHVFNYQDLKTLVPVTYAEADSQHQTACCSDSAVSFGQQSAKELRMAYYASYQLNPFGRGGTIFVNTSYAIDPKKLKTAPITKSPPKKDDEKKTKEEHNKKKEEKKEVVKDKRKVAQKEEKKVTKRG